MFQILAGKRDGRVSLAAYFKAHIIDTSFSMDELINVSSSKDFLEDVIALLSKQIALKLYIEIQL